MGSATLIDAKAKLREALLQFPSEIACLAELESLRWPDCEPFCPHCGAENLQLIPAKAGYLCRAEGCGKWVSGREGTPLARSAIKLRPWFATFWVEANYPWLCEPADLAEVFAIKRQAAAYLLKRIRQALEVSGSGNRAA
jgi:transposase-like protein